MFSTCQTLPIFFDSIHYYTILDDKQKINTDELLNDIIIYDIGTHFE